MPGSPHLGGTATGRRKTAETGFRNTVRAGVSRLIPFIGLILLLSIVGCGTESARQPKALKGEGQISTCGVRGGFEFKLQKVDCETANTLIVMLDGRALHQSVVLKAEGKLRGAWVCASPTHSLIDRLHCRQGTRSFTVTRAR
jgi:hypothetical protein